MTRIALQRSAGQAQASTMLASRANDGSSTAATPGSATLGDPTNYNTLHPSNGNPSIYQYTPNARAGSAQKSRQAAELRLGQWDAVHYEVVHPVPAASRAVADPSAWLSPI